MSVDIHPNGNDIAFELVGDIYTIPKKGGQAKSIIKGRAFQSQPRFSKDGKWIVFISDESGSDNIWIAKSNGKSMRKLTAIENSTMLSPSWSVDDKEIFVTVITQFGFSSFAEIWSYNIESGEGKLLVKNQNGPSQPLVSSPAPGPYGPVSDLDGSSILFSSVTPRIYNSRKGAESKIFRLDLNTGQTSALALKVKFA